MKVQKMIRGLVAGAVSVSFAASAFAIDAVTAPLGTPAPAAKYGRIVKLDPSSKYMRVKRGETITIVNGEKSFGWTFDTYGDQSFDLAKIAPQNFGTGHIRVYVREPRQD